MGLGELPPTGLCLEMLSVGYQPWSGHPDPAGGSIPGAEARGAGSPQACAWVFTRGKCYSGLMETLQKPQFDSTGCYY